jgi:hypothetical protein
MTLLLSMSYALACAGLVHEEGALAESGASTTVFEQGDGETTVTFEVLYEGDAEDFGWIVPVPAAVLSVEDGDQEQLDGLKQNSAPLVYTPTPVAEERKGCGPASKGSDEALRGGADNGIEITAQGFTGSYDYVVVEATDATALTEWASGNGWSIAGVQADLQHYIDLGHRFVLLDLHADAVESGTIAMPPVAIRYASEELRFPSVMAHSGDDQHNSVYVIGDSRAQLTEGWTHKDLGDLYGADATAVFEEALTDMGVERTWGRTWAQPYGGRFATRFDLIAGADLHDRDAIFGLDGTTTTLTTTIELDGSGGQALMLLLPLVGLLGLRRRQA